MTSTTAVNDWNLMSKYFLACPDDDSAHESLEVGISKRRVFGHCFNLIRGTDNFKSKTDDREDISLVHWK